MQLPPVALLPNFVTQNRVTFRFLAGTLCHRLAALKATPAKPPP